MCLWRGRGIACKSHCGLYNLRMLNIGVSIATASAQRLFGSDFPKALPYIKATMLTKLAQAGRDAIQKKMPVVFDQPVKYTINGVMYRRADKNKPAEVYVPTSHEAQGRAAHEYLRPGAYGATARRQKKTEFLLSRSGVLPPSWVTVPGKGAYKLGWVDAAGNMKGRYYALIINVLQVKKLQQKGARSTSAASAKRALKMGVETEFFAVSPGKNKLGKGGGSLPPGVYRRSGKGGSALHQILKFVAKAKYSPRLDFAEVVQEQVVTGALAAWNGATYSVLQRFKAAAPKKQ